jgi:hypothetical protein
MNSLAINKNRVCFPCEQGRQAYQSNTSSKVNLAALGGCPQWMAAFDVGKHNDRHTIFRAAQGVLLIHT